MMKVVASGASYQARAVQSIVSSARSSGKSEAEFVVPDRASANAVVETYGRDAVKVQRSTAHKVSVRV